ncbi:MAG: HEAT repeat domain-containing protein, partial [Trueperaceae bacterium]|nr:HEAT repeat domain-containing protein [Trueperaceae bacterium]
THHLAAAVEAETGRNVEWFFDQWVFKPGHPEFKVSWNWDEAAKLATVSVRQVQKTDDGTPVFRAPLTIDFTTGRSRPAAFKVEVTEPEHTFVFPLPRKPDLCRFDPGNFVLKTLDFEKSTGELRLQLRQDDDVTGRIGAARSLGKKGGPEAVEALEAAVMGDRFWAVQAAAAKALGAVRSAEARDALIRCLAVRHPKARRGVVAGLGEFRGDEAAFAALEPLAKQDQSWFVESEANRSIGKLRVDRSFETVAANIKRPSWRQLVRTGCADGFVELRDERAFDLLFEEARYGARPQFRQNMVAAIGRLGAFFEPRKRQLGARLADFLFDPDLRVRVAAANAIKAIKDTSQIPALEAMAARELDGRAIRTAREAARDLRKGAATDEEVRRLRDDFEKLRDENAKLRDRLAKLEAKPARAPKTGG